MPTPTNIGCLNCRRLNQPIALLSFITPSVPVISTIDQTVLVPYITISGTGTQDNFIAILVEVGGVQVARCAPVSGAWSVNVPLAAGANTVRAREKNEGNSTFSDYCVDKTMTYQQYTPVNTPAISTAEGTVSEPCIDLTGTATNAIDISVSIEVGGVEKERVYSVAGAWSAAIPLAAGANSIRAREKSDDEVTVSAYCAAKTFTYQQWITPIVPVITNFDTPVYINMSAIYGTCQNNPDIRVGIQGSDAIEVEHSGGNWSVQVTIDEGSFEFQAREINKGGDVSAWTNPVTIECILRTIPNIPVIATAEQTVTEPGILLEGTCTEVLSSLDDILVSVWVNGEEKTRVQPFDGVWFAFVELIEGPNIVKAQEVNLKDDESAFCDEKTFIYTPASAPVTPPLVPSITTVSQTIVGDYILVQGTCQDAVDISVEIAKNDESQIMVKQVSGTWAALIALDNGANVMKAREVNGADDTSAWCASIVIIMTATPSVPIVTTVGTETYKDTLDIAGTCGPDSLIRIFIDGIDTGQQVYVTGSSWTVEAVKLNLGDNVISAKAERTIENIVYKSNSSNSITVTRISLESVPRLNAPGSFHDTEVQRVRGGHIPATSDDPKTPRNVHGGKV